MFKSDSIYLAAKATEAGALIAAQQTNNPGNAAAIYSRASDMYLTHGAADKAAEMLEKAGRTTETTNVDKAIEYYIMACTLYEQEDRGRFAVETFKRTVSVLLKNKRYPKAVEILTRMAEVMEPLANKAALFKVYLSIIITLLEMKDDVEAGKRYDIFLTSPGFAQSDEVRAAGELLDAFEKRDPDMLQTVISQQTFTFLDNEVARLAQQLRVPGGGSARTASETLAPPRPLQSVIPLADTVRNSPHMDSEKPISPSAAAKPTLTDDFDDDDMC